MKTPDIETYFSQSPLIAILRGIRPDEIIGCATVIVDAGWQCIEVPLNSPSPLESVKLLADHFGDRILSGAGTVLTPQQARAVTEAGGRLIVAPNTNPAVIAEARKHGAAVMPGFLTATEAFQAYDAGARWLKLFPADSAGPAYIKALRSVLPPDAKVIPVGGVTPANLAAFREAGGIAFGVGSQVYKPGMALADVRARAEAFMSACIAR
jgi:2-dehydro-3-deoxyphosphogalactonate aldolase